jgi:gliding motility-associated-like protein
LVAINGTSCSDTTEMNVCVTEGFSFWMPNTFTPDGDGINDVFIPKGTGWMENFYSFEIINKWGVTVFKTTDQNTFWDGKTGGGRNTDDVYAWIVNVRDIRNRTYEFTGHVLIMR